MAAPDVRDGLPCSREEYRTWLTDSCRRHGVPLVVSDPETIRAVATLLPPPKRRGRKARGRKG
jgi:hypothetical protein